MSIEIQGDEGFQRFGERSPWTVRYHAKTCPPGLDGANGIRLGGVAIAGSKAFRPVPRIGMVVVVAGAWLLEPTTPFDTVERCDIHPDTNQVPRLLADRPGELVLTGNNRPSWYPIRVG